MTAIAPRNVPELFLERVGKTPDAVAFQHPAADGGYMATLDAMYAGEPRG